MPKPLLLAIALTSVLSSFPGIAAAQEPAAPAPHGLTVEEEARVLALEDRREYDPKLVAEWVSNPNPLHRVRIAQALGRIGPHTFVDPNNNGVLDPGEKRAGVTELAALAGDKDRNVRAAVAFALGEIGDPESTGTLFYLASDADPGVAAEAVEGLSKIAALDPKFRLHGIDRYLWNVRENVPEGVRARATRYLFRFDRNDASDQARQLLADKSALVRREAAYALARRTHAAAREQLQLMMSDPDVLTRAYAAAALGRIAHEASAPSLIKALGDIHPWVRTNAAVALAKVMEQNRSVVEAKDLPRIYAALEDPDPGVRAVTVDLLGYYAAKDGGARNRLTGVLKNGSQWERELAAGAIAKQFAADTETYKQLGELTPWQIVRVLEATASTAQGAELRKKYATSAVPQVRVAALSSVPDTAVDTELDMIRRGFDDPDVMVRAAAYERYGLATSENAQLWLPRLQAAEKRERSESMNDGRIAAVQAIAKLNWPGRRGFLNPLLKDNDPVVRRVAADEISKAFKQVVRYTPLQVRRSDSEYQEIVRWSRQPHTATIDMTRGRIELALLTQDAPITTWNFAQLARKKYFDGTTFMRVVPNFVVQGGDPRNDMSGGPGYAIRDEINQQKYTRGAVGMALSGPDTGGSQFFIVHSPQPHLDGGYTVFARVYEGMSGVVDQIERGDKVERITIDAHPPVGEPEMSAVPNVSLPLRVGPVTRAEILAELPDYDALRGAYAPDATVLEMLKPEIRRGDRLEVFLGTWCDDSQREIPKLIRIVDDLQAQYGVELPVTYVAVDRSKREPASLLKAGPLSKIATIVYYRDGTEIGRIEERPVGVLEDALLAIAAARPQP